MLSTIGRSLAPTLSRPLFPFKSLNFTQSLPSFVTFERNSPATYRNNQGKLVQASHNEPRIDHTEDGKPLGLFIEPASTNKCGNNNVNPVDTSGFSTAGTGTLTIVNDSAELAAAGLEGICTSGLVFKASATSGSTFIVYAPGAVGNLNPHSISLYARGEGVGIRTARLSIGGDALNIAPAGEQYQRYMHDDLTPDSASRRLTLIIDGNDTLYFVLYQLEESSASSSVIPLNGNAITRPTDKAYINDIHQEDWFDENQGYLICRYNQKKLLNTDAYAAVLNDGTAANTIGLRLDQNNHNLRAYIIAGSSPQFLFANLDYQIEGTMNAAAIRWNSQNADLLSGGESKSAALTQTPTGINTLNIGTRNGGSGSLHGHIESIEIGAQDITLKQLGNRLQKHKDYNIIGAGQSLMRGHFKSQESNGEQGKQEHRRVIGQALPNRSIVLIDGSTGGSAACKTSNDTLYWYDLAVGEYGPAFNTFYQQIDELGAKPTHVLWAQGEEDSHEIGTNTTKEQYKQTLEIIFSDMRQILGGIKIFIQRIGRRTLFSNNGGVQAIRDIQQQIIDENEWCYEAAEVYDQDLHDHVHLTDAAYVNVAKRNSSALLEEEGHYGSDILSASRSGSTIAVILNHQTANDFTPATSIEGFRFFVENIEIAITNATRISGNVIELTLASVPSSGVETLYYGYDDMANITPQNVIMTNNVLNSPLRTSKLII
jgi:hypothetical protein